MADTPKKIVVAIDGPAGSGKSTSARALAAKIGYTFIDTGAMYRGVTYKVLQDKVDPNNEEAVVQIAKTVKLELSSNNEVTILHIDGVDCSAEVRDPTVSQNVSKVASYAEVREILVDKQREMGNAGGVVMDGRDIGTVVFPKAELKIFMQADPEERANRRCKELSSSGKQADHKEVLTSMVARDKADSEREVSPLKKADDAIAIDTTQLSPDQVVELLEGYVREAEKKK